jgi:hypothetical protein
VLAQTRPTLTQMCALASEVFQQLRFVLLSGCGRRLGAGGLEFGMAGVTVVDVAEEVEVVIEEVCRISLVYSIGLRNRGSGTYRVGSH